MALAFRSPTFTRSTMSDRSSSATATSLARSRRAAIGALLAELEKRKRRLDENSEELLATDGRGIHARLREIEDFVLNRLKDLKWLLAGEIPRAKAELAKHRTDIALTPEGKTYRLSGEWDLLGVRSDGAGGRNWTERLPVKFEWLAAA